MSWTEVSVSARTLAWPDRCACCQGPADVLVPVSASRQTGIRVIRTQTATVQVPHCRRCLEHGRAQAGLAAFQEAAGRQAQAQRQAAQAAAWKPSPLTDPGFLLGWAAGVLFLAGAALGLAFLVAGLPGLLVGASRESLTGAVLFLAGVFWLAALGPAGLWWLGRWRDQEADRAAACRRDLADAVQDSARAQAALQTAQGRANALLGPSCIPNGAAVRFAGWQGSVHHFLFHSPAFAEAFRQVNGARVRGSPARTVGPAPAPAVRTEAPVHTSVARAAPRAALRTGTPPAWVKKGILSTQCPRCGARHNYQDFSAGTVARCAGCGGKFLCPGMHSCLEQAACLLLTGFVLLFWAGCR